MRCLSWDLGTVSALLLAPAHHFMGLDLGVPCQPMWCQQWGQPHSWSMSVGLAFLLVDGSLGSKCTANLYAALI